MTAYYSNQLGGGNQTIKSGTGTTIGGGGIMRNMPLSSHAGTTFNGSRKPSKLDKKMMEEEIEKLEEIETVENQIDWFERTRVDENKRPRYANLNLKEMPNYQDRFTEKLAAKRLEQER